jgi:uncharacterized membrane protein YphA (DoxX/SURF4 family)
LSIYVEQLIRTPLEAVWSHTQDPALHQRWDLRFTQIDYLPRSDANDPQAFRYATRLGFGLAVEGTGETVGQRNGPDGSHTSALRFESGQARSLIREGRGYWKYIPTADGVRFLTAYDYSTRYGVGGRLLDRLAFRPLMGWATAWSFDRLRLWLERGIDPAQAGRQALAHGIARVAIATIFLYHGLVPKLLGPDPSVVRLAAAAGLPANVIQPALAALGVIEVVFAILLIATWHRAWPAVVAGLFAVGALVLATATAADSLTLAFNPVSTNLALLALASVDRVTLDGIPSAGRCARHPAANPVAAEPAPGAP